MRLFRNIRSISRRTCNAAILEMKSRSKLTYATVIICVLAFATLFVPIERESIERFYPLRIFSKEQILLREYRNEAGAYGSSLQLEKHPYELVRALIVAEDARFYWHVGIDPIAVVRAAIGNLKDRRIRSGASTITQQIARILYAETLPQNRYLKKIVEAALSLRLTFGASKHRVLEAYLNQVPLPLNSQGFSAASTRIFGKHITLLSNEEIVALVIMVSHGTFIRNGCSQYSEDCPQKNIIHPAFQAAFVKLWKKLYGEKIPDWQRLESTLLNTRTASNISVRGSQHIIAWLKENKLPAAGDISSEISANLSESVANIVANEMPAIQKSGAEHAAVVVIEKNADRDILRVLVGSSDFSAPLTGEINHAVRIRSAGSTLKPFVYGIGIENKTFNATTMFSDSELSLATGRENETYRPHNNDMRFWGNLTLRESLVASRNIPALSAAAKIGIPTLLEFFRNSGMTHLTQAPDYYGAGLALGSGGTTLLHLARLYSSLASHGEMRPLELGHDSAGNPLRLGKRQRIFSVETADRITHMLADAGLRRRAFGNRSFMDFPFPIAEKTGTSKDYRDGWIAGFTEDFVVAVWVGNSVGKPMRSVSGAWGAGRIFHPIVRLLNGNKRKTFHYSPKLKEIRICRRSGKLAGAHCPAHAELIPQTDELPRSCLLRHTPGEYAGDDGAIPLVLSPVAGERYVLHPNEAAARQEIPLIIRQRGAQGYAYALDASTPQPLTRDVRKFVRLAAGDYTLRIFSHSVPTEEIAFSVR